MTAFTVPRELIEQGNKEIREISLSSGEIACDSDCLCSNLLVVARGCLRVYKRSEDGRTFTLYRVNSGECCSLTISCILNDTTFPAIVEVEDDVLAYAVPAQHVRKCLREDEECQEYIFEQLSKKVTQLTDLTDNLVFNNMDSRIANLLCRRLEGNTIIYATHQCIANEVGTSREVVSRSLRLLESKDFQDFINLKSSFLSRQYSFFRTIYFSIKECRGKGH